MDAARTIERGRCHAMCRTVMNLVSALREWGISGLQVRSTHHRGCTLQDMTEKTHVRIWGTSAITETVGVGGMAMIAAPAVTRFVGAGGYEDALRTSTEMTEITIDRNPNFIIPNWNFQGTLSWNRRKTSSGKGYYSGDQYRDRT